ncbi:flagellar FlbD family protein [Sulfoacidibacillus thermotolerans]|uniref:Flagellar protein FlbD n=1 Tax=Sulfoacidibacillus thermotolerans TaxID=1765684 RepID=A0A2U3DAB1_SULT2|nr:flagellar FlbD family protein [Sulfoacidibacillus thermotolerans]PWI58193.1 hypothetical protein BM613_04475 [Sulfoacidibacillus thermotolerans]
MIHLTRMNGISFHLNAIMIEVIEATPDTVITLVSGRKYIVREHADEVIDQITRYYRSIGLVGNIASQVGGGHLE